MFDASKLLIQLSTTPYLWSSDPCLSWRAILENVEHPSRWWKCIPENRVFRQVLQSPRGHWNAAHFQNSINFYANTPLTRGAVVSSRTKIWRNLFSPAIVSSVSFLVNTLFISMPLTRLSFTWTSPSTTTSWNVTAPVKVPPDDRSHLAGYSADRGIRNEFFNDNMVDREIMINILVDGVS